MSDIKEIRQRWNNGDYSGPADADIEGLLTALERLEQENQKLAALAAKSQHDAARAVLDRADNMKWEEREAAMCPEDVGFEEYIVALQGRVVAAEDSAVANRANYEHARRMLDAAEAALAEAERRLRERGR